MAVELVMQVSRDDGDRLTGTVGPVHGSGAREFSGVLQLLHVFEELVPLAEPAANRKERS